MFSVLRIVDEHAFFDLSIWVTIALTNPFVTLFWIWVFHKIINKQSFSSLGLKIYGYKDDFIEGLLLGFGLMVLGFGVLYVFDFLSVNQIKFSLNHHLLYVIVFAIVAIGEETAIRGFILQNLSSSFNKYIALVLSSLVFMIMHIGNPNMSAVPLFNLFLAGLLLGVYCIHKNNLWFPIGAHITWNYFQGPVLGFEVSGNDVDSIFIQSLNGSELITGGEFGFEGSIILTVLMIIGIVYLDRRFSSA